MSAADWSILVLLSILWGSSFFSVKIALRDVGAMVVVLGRITGGAFFLLLFLSMSGYRLPTSPRVWGKLLTLSLLNQVVPFCLIVWAQTKIESGLAAIFNATVPMLTVTLAHFVTVDERLTVLKAAGVFFGLAGVTVLMGPDAIASGSGKLVPELAVVAAAFCYACAGLYGRRMKETPPMVLATGQTVGSALIFWPLMLLLPYILPADLQPMADLSKLATATRPTFLAIASLGFLSTAVATSLYFYLLRSAGVTNITLVTFLIPVSSLLLGTLFLDESIELREVGGMGLIALGLASLDGRLVRRFLIAPKA